MFSFFHERIVKNTRLTRLIQQTEKWIAPDTTVLDLGAGDGRFAQQLSINRPDLKITAIDPLTRKIQYFPVQAYKTKTVPFEDHSFDFVLLIDVLHHCEVPLEVFSEAARIAKKGVIVKDHTLQGWFSGPTLWFMDWIGNKRFGVDIPCHYWTKQQWYEATTTLQLHHVEYQDKLNLYPMPLRLFFDRKLHFLALYNRPFLRV